MKRVTFTVREPIVENGKIAFAEKQVVRVVASTKTQNIAQRELEEQGLTVLTGKTVAEDLFVDRDLIEATISKCMADYFGDTETESKVFDHIMKVLDGGCIFKK